MLKKALFIVACVIVSTGICAESNTIAANAHISWYGADFHGKQTSSGEIYNMNELTAAHKTLPFGTVLEVINLENGKKVVVKVNDRGPFVQGRELDVSKAAAEKLDMISTGLARASITIINKHDTPTATSTQTSQGQSAGPAVPAGFRWRIQLASFTVEENASRLAVRLQEQGFHPAFERSAGYIRIVLPGIRDGELEGTKAKLTRNGYLEYLVKKESIE